MPKPFPFPITVGTDICHVKRIYKILTASGSAIGVGNGILDAKAKKFIYRVLTKEEVDEATRMGRLRMSMLENETPSPEDFKQISAMARFLGGRYVFSPITRYSLD